MGKTLLTTCKMCRREGVSLCGRERCALKRRPYPPGVHGPTARASKLSGYGKQLREKQKAKRLYQVMERQFRRYFEMARRRRGNTATFLIQILEQRLDNVVYRLGFAATRRHARQMVSHGFVSVNGKNVNIPSALVRVGDEVAIRPAKAETTLVKNMSERIGGTSPPAWLHLDVALRTGKVVGLPEGEALETVFDPTLIVELYSR